MARDYLNQTYVAMVTVTLMMKVMVRGLESGVWFDYGNTSSSGGPFKRSAIIYARD